MRWYGRILISWPSQRYRCLRFCLVRLGLHLNQICQNLRREIQGWLWQDDVKNVGRQLLWLKRKEMERRRRCWWWINPQEMLRLIHHGASHQTLQKHYGQQQRCRLQNVGPSWDYTQDWWERTRRKATLQIGLLKMDQRCWCSFRNDCHEATLTRQGSKLQSCLLVWRTHWWPMRLSY